MAELLTREPLPTNGEAPPAPRLTRLGDLLEDWSADAEAAHQARVAGVPRGPTTNLDNLDRELGGALADGVHIVHGGPGIGKTAFVLQVAAECGCSALFVTCEMAPLELLRRHTARVTTTYMGRLKSGEFTPADSLAKARTAAQAAPDLVIADATHAWADPDWLRQAAEVTRGDAQHLLIVVDSVHSWAEGMPVQASEYDALNGALAALRKLAADLSCPILATAERNRARMEGGGLHAAAGSRRFEYGSETVLELDRDGDDPPDAAGQSAVTLTIAKNRNGTPGRKVDLFFQGALQRFRED